MMAFVKRHKIWFISGGVLLVGYLVYRWNQNRQSSADQAVDPNAAANAAALQAAYNAQGLGAVGQGTLVSNTPSQTPQSPAGQALQTVSTPDLASILAAANTGSGGVTVTTPGASVPTPAAAAATGGIDPSVLAALLASLGAQPSGLPFTPNGTGGTTTPPTGTQIPVDPGVPVSTGTPAQTIAQPILGRPPYRGSGLQTPDPRLFTPFKPNVPIRNLTTVPMTTQTTRASSRPSVAAPAASNPSPRGGSSRGVTTITTTSSRRRTA